jgi:hypothetical protein
MNCLMNQAGAVPSTLSLDYDALLSSTLFAYQSKLRDNITRGNKFLAYMEEYGKFRKQDGGERVQIPLMYAQNSSTDIYSGYGVLDTTPQDGITSAFFDWAQLSGSISISRKEERQNSGRSRILNLLEAKTQQAEAGIKELLDACIVAGRITASAADGQFLRRIGRVDSGAFGPYPFAALIDTDPTRSVSIGNINGNTYSWWRNKNASSAATTWAGYKNELVNMYNTCSRGINGSPDLMISDQVAWEQYWGALQNFERYIVTDSKKVDILGGTTTLAFMKAAWVWEELVPDVETNAEVFDGIGTVTASTVFFINSQSMEYVVDSQTDFITTPFVRPENQDARVSQILWMGVTGVNNRRKNGVLDGIQRTAFTA